MNIKTSWQIKSEVNSILVAVDRNFDIGFSTIEKVPPVLSYLYNIKTVIERLNIAGTCFQS